MDGELFNLIIEERQRPCTLAALNCGGHSVTADDAPHELSAMPENVVDNLTWPIRTNNSQTPDNAENDTLSTDELPEELRLKSVTSGNIHNKYRLYKYNPERWRLCYRGSGCSTSHDHMSHSGRRFDGERRNLDTSVLERMHGGVDLFADYGNPVVAVMDGQIIGFDRSAPVSTCFLFIYHPDITIGEGEDSEGITINYGEVHHESLIRMGLMVGDNVDAGQIIATIGKMSSLIRHRGSMLHFETYRGRNTHWRGIMLPFTNLHGRINPTKLLISIREAEHHRIPLHEQWEQQRALGMPV
jgi:murein DD-endopeptidase MepM/ murein hydrolase activator NlpD